MVVRSDLFAKSPIASPPISANLTVQKPWECVREDLSGLSSEEPMITADVTGEGLAVLWETTSRLRMQNGNEGQQRKEVKRVTKMRTSVSKRRMASMS